MTERPGLTERLRDRLGEVEYTHDAVVALIGTTAHEALGRNETVPAYRATSGGGPLATLIRLWLLQRVVSVEEAERALGDLVDPLCGAGILRRTMSEVAAAVDIRPYQADDRHLWLASDLTPGLDGRQPRVGADHVLGISPAALSLASLTVRDRRARALDLGTGCGVQALHLAEHVEEVVATDVNQRALWLTRLNASLNEVRVETRAGDLFEPVAGERFDLVVTNPPFVISPGTGERLVYRDSGLPGDQVVERLVRGMPGHLAAGGFGHVLANWMITRDRPWQERIGDWLDPSCDAWVVQRETVDLPGYVELWLKDAGLHGAPDYAERYDTWLSWLEEQGVVAIGFGWLTVHHRGHSSGRASGSGDHRLEEWPWEVEQPLGGEIAAHFARVDALRERPDGGLAAVRARLRPDVRQETFGAAGAADPGQIVLRQQTGLRRARQVDTREAALAGACDGDLTLGQIAAALDDLLGPGADDLATARELVAEGFLDLPATAP